MTIPEFTRLKHDLRNSVNHILGYSQLVQESAMDLGDENTAARAENIEAYGQLIGSQIDELASAAAQAPDAKSIESLRLAFLPLVEQILKAASSGGKSAPAPAYADDLQKICTAANHLVALVITA
jgi:light-regulated signal transduction histidine kinase (bacteriophytochrome)